MNKLSWLIIPIFILITIQFTISNIKILAAPVSGDFEYFYITGQRAISEQNPYVKYGEGFLRNPPPSLFVYTILPIFPLQTSQIVLFIISSLAFLVGSYFLFKIIGQSPNWKVWLIYLSLVLIFFPFRYTLGSGHINNLLFLFIVLAFYFLKQKKETISGFFLALAISLSVTPVFLMVILFLQKNYRAFLWTIFSLIIISAVTLLRFGSDVFKNYQLASSSYLDFGISAYYNQSLAGLLNRIFNNPAFTQTVVFIILAIALLIFFYFISKTSKTKNKTNQNMIIWSIGIIYLLIFAPFAWQYHFVIIIFPLVTTVYLVVKNRIPYLFYLLWILSYLMIGWNIKNPQLFQNLNILGGIILSHVLIGAIILLLLNYYLLKKILR